MLNTVTSLDSRNQMIGSQAAKPQEPPQIQLCVQLMEEEAKRLRAAVEHLAGLLGIALWVLYRATIGQLFMPQ